MDNHGFMSALSDYYGNTKERVLSWIGFEVARIDEKDLQRLFDDIIGNVPPSRVIGVSDIRAAMSRCGFFYKAKQESREAILVDCDICGLSYRWVQSSADPENGLHDKCPRCKFPWYETWVAREYEGKHHGPVEGYKKIKEKLRSEWNVKRQQAR